MEAGNESIASGNARCSATGNGSTWILAPEKCWSTRQVPWTVVCFDREQVWIRLKTGVTLLEKVHEESTDNRTTVRVTASTLKRNPTSVTEIESNRLMTFYEDWDLTRADSGTQIQKTWRDLTVRCAGCPLAG